MKSFYSLLLYLFPRTYREEYGDELQTVFDLSFADAKNGGWLGIVDVILRELAALPIAIIHEHLRERRKTKMLKRFGSHFDFVSGSFLEFLGALYPFFLLGGVLPLMSVLMRSNFLTPQSVLVNGIGILLVAILGILCLIGLAKGLPRWSLPYLGFLFSLFSVFQLGMWLERRRVISFTALYARSWFLGQIAYQGMLWVGISVVMLVLVLMISFIPFLRRFREDWTLLTLVTYGASPLALVFAFDEYINEEPFELFAYILLAAGLWFYLRNNDPHRRFWALFGGLAASLLFAAVSKAFMSSPLWPYEHYYYEGYSSFPWQTEMMSTVIMWMWVALSMLIPLVLTLLPQAKNHTRTPDVAVM